MRLSTRLSGAFAFVLLAALPARATPDRSLAFVRMAGGADAQHLETMEEAFLASLSDTGFFSRVTGRHDLAALLGLERMKQLAGCDDSGCLTELAGALGVAYLGTADIGKLGDVTVVTLRVLDAKTAEVAAREMRQLKDESSLLSAIDGLAKDAVVDLKLRERRLHLVTPPLGLAFVPFGVGQYANGSPVKGTLFLVGELAAFATSGYALSQFEASKLPGSGGVFEGGTFRDPAAAAQLQSTYLAAFWTGVGLAAVGVVEALVSRE